MELYNYVQLHQVFKGKYGKIYIIYTDLEWANFLNVSIDSV